MITERCGGCGNEVETNVGQSPYTLSWWISINCPHCGAKVEVDGGEEAPNDVRAAILAEHGVWALQVEIDEDASKLKVIAALRSILGLTIAQTSELKARLPCQVARGTRSEMERHRQRLGTQGVVSRLVLLEAGTEQLGTEALHDHAPPMAAGRDLCTACGRWLRVSGHRERSFRSIVNADSGAS